MKETALCKRACATTLLAVLIAGTYSGESEGWTGKGHDATSRPHSVPTTNSSARASTAGSWDPKAAATYLDQREQWWSGWQEAAREQGTFCVSCHTAVPYALARPVLRKVLGESAATDNERILLENVRKRVRLWKEIAPVYNDKEDGPNKSAESRATEAVLLAFVLANNDGQSGKLSDDTQRAFDNLWGLQQTAGNNQGAWLWQLFDLSPWESRISQYYGATLAAIAVGAAPENYRSAPAIQKNLAMLRDYLDREYSAQPLVNRVTLLWASLKVPGLLMPERQKSIIKEILDKQRADGGWGLFPMARTWRDWGPDALLGNWKRDDGTAQETGSDGYATGLAVFALQQTGVPRENPQLKRGREWLVKNQNKAEGLWVTFSLNKRRDLSSNVGRFMSDAATAYAVLALTN